MNIKLGSYEDMKGNLHVRVVDVAANREKLEKVLSKPVGCGYALVPYLALPELPGGIINIPKDFPGHVGMDAEAIFEDAMNTASEKDKPTLRPILEALYGNTDINLLEKDAPDLTDEMYVLTTSDGRLGAAALFYPGMEEKIREILGVNYYVLPSSVHEVLIVPEIGKDPEILLRMVTEVNAAEVALEDRLGDRVLYWDGQKFQVYEDEREEVSA